MESLLYSNVAVGLKFILFNFFFLNLWAKTFFCRILEKVHVVLTLSLITPDRCKNIP